MSISWGRQERYKFASGGQLNSWVPPVTAGVFAITYKQDPGNRPKAHTVLFFGEANDLSTQVSSICQKVINAWTARGGRAYDFYVFFHPMEGSSQFDRLRIHDRLIAEYQPHGNDM